MPEGCVTHALLACDEQYRGELKTLLKEYREVFPMNYLREFHPTVG